MKTKLIRLLVMVLLNFLLSNSRVRDVLSDIAQADQEFSNDFAKRGYVYRQLKEREGDAQPSYLLNTAVELGVLLHKRLS